jgi:hypothetical protein
MRSRVGSFLQWLSRSIRLDRWFVIPEAPLVSRRRTHYSSVRNVPIVPEPTTRCYIDDLHLPLYLSKFNHQPYSAIMNVFSEHLGEFPKGFVGPLTDCWRYAGHE